MPFSQVLFVSIYLYLNFVWLLHNILTRTEFTCNHDYEEKLTRNHDFQYCVHGSGVSLYCTQSTLAQG